MRSRRTTILCLVRQRRLSPKRGSISFSPTCTLWNGSLGCLVRPQRIRVPPAVRRGFASATGMNCQSRRGSLPLKPRRPSMPLHHVSEHTKPQQKVSCYLRAQNSGLFSAMPLLELVCPHQLNNDKLNLNIKLIHRYFSLSFKRCSCCRTLPHFFDCS